MAETAPRAHNGAPTRRRRHRRIVVVGLVIGFVLVVIGLLTAYVGNRALTAKEDLERAEDQLRILRTAAGQADQNLPELYAPVAASTAHAVQQTHDPVWSVYEHVWRLGPNLTAVRQTAELVDALVRDGAGPMAQAANGLSVDNLTPRHGRVDLAPLQKLAPAIVETDEALQRASTSAQGIDTSHVVPQVKQAVVDLQAQLKEITPAVGQARTIVPLLYPLLGGDGTRHYLLMFQNNAEERASGGNPASLALLKVHNGKITLGRQASSSDFPHPYEKPPFTPSGPRNQDWGTVYTDYASAYLTNITMTPDFPTTAKLATAMWQQQYGGKVDGVVSFDPVALSYLLKATGPIELADGTTIDASNAVSFLLSDVYAKYPDGKTQDKVFASAARSVFTTVMSGTARRKGTGGPQAYLAQLKPAVAEQRLKVWSAHPEEQRLLLQSPVGTMLPADNTRATVLGVYNNDDATSKMSYYLDEKVTVATDTCQAQPSYTVSATVINTMRRDQIDALPAYVRAHQQRIPRGGDRQWVQVFGPVGGTLEDVWVGGKKVVWGTSLDSRANSNGEATGVDSRRPAVRGTMYDRPVGVVSVTLGPDARKTVKAVFRGRPDDSRTVEVSHTPKVRDVPVTVTTTACR